MKIVCREGVDVFVAVASSAKRYSNPRPRSPSQLEYIILLTVRAAGDRCRASALRPLALAVLQSNVTFHDAIAELYRRAVDEDVLLGSLVNRTRRAAVLQAKGMMRNPLVRSAAFNILGRHEGLLRYCRKLLRTHAR